MAARAVLVTGGHQRLGKAIALSLGRQGFDVAISFRSSPDLAQQVVAELRAQGVHAIAVAAELTDPVQVRQLIDQVAQEFGHLDAVIASAASYRPTPLNLLDALQLDAILVENARAPVDLLLAAAPWLRQSADGRAVLLGDLAGFTPFRGYLAHSMAKAALHAAVAGLAAEWAPEILVGGVAPGAVLQPAELADADWRRLQTAVPMGKMALEQPEVPVEAVCAAVLWWLTCPRFAAGQVLRVDGGRSARW